MPLTFKAYENDGNIFLDIGSGYLVYIATVEEVEKATQDELSEMIARAVSTRVFDSISSSDGLTKQ